MEHPDEGYIHAWLDGELSATDSAAIEQHVAECDECSALVAEARGLIAASSRIVSALDDVPGDVIPRELPAAGKARTQVTSIQEAAAASAIRARATASAPSWWRRSGVAAAALLFVAAGSVLVTQKGENNAMLSMDSVASSPVGGPSAPSLDSAIPQATIAERGPVVQDMVAQGAVQRAAKDDRAARAIGEDALARRVASGIDASAREPRREQLRQEAAMSAPASNPVAAPPSVTTSPVIAATPPPAAPVVATGAVSGVAGAAAGGTAANRAAAGASRGAADLTGAGARMNDRAGTGAEVRSSDTTANRNAARVDATAARNSAAAASAARTTATANAAAFQASERQAAAPTASRAPTPQSDGAMRNTIVTPLLGCYTVSSANVEPLGRLRASAEAASAGGLPTRVRLSDTVTAGGSWFVARAVDRPQGRVALQWRPVSRDSLELRAVAAADTTAVRMKFGAEAGAAGMRRVGC